MRYNKAHLERNLRHPYIISFVNLCYFCEYGKYVVYFFETEENKIRIEKMIFLFGIFINLDWIKFWVYTVGRYKLNLMYTS